MFLERTQKQRSLSTLLLTLVAVGVLPAALAAQPSERTPFRHDQSGFSIDLWVGDEVAACQTYPGPMDGVGHCDGIDVAAVRAYLDSLNSRPDLMAVFRSTGFEFELLGVIQAEPFPGGDFAAHALAIVERARAGLSSRRGVEVQVRGPISGADFDLFEVNGTPTVGFEITMAEGLDQAQLVYQLYGSDSVTTLTFTTSADNVGLVQPHATRILATAVLPYAPRASPEPVVQTGSAGASSSNDAPEAARDGSVDLLFIAVSLIAVVCIGVLGALEFRKRTHGGS